MTVSKTSGPGLVARGAQARESADAVIRKREDRRVADRINEVLQRQGVPAANAQTAARKWRAAVEDQRTARKDWLSLGEAEARLIRSEQKVLARMAAVQSGTELDEAAREDRLSDLELKLQQIVEDKEGVSDLIRETQESLRQASDAARSVEQRLED